jgi:cell division septal protein FtsQ
MENKIKIYWNKVSEQVKKFFSHVFWVLLVVVGLGIGFGVGFYYKQIKTVELPSKMIVVEKQDVILAVDEYQRLMLIDRNTGNYTIYDNEIGKSIFTLYARNIWGQHNPNQTPPPAK